MLINGGTINGTVINGLFGEIVYPVIPVDKKIIVSTHFICTFSDTSSGLDDIDIPISSISGSLNVVGSSSLLIVCPNGVLYSDEITLRSAGTFTIKTTEYYNDGTNTQVSSVEYDIDTIASDKGASAWSVSIRGLKTFTSTITSQYVAEGMSILTINADGKKRVRIDYNADLLPNDTLDLGGGETIVSGVITYTISTKNMYMTVTEA